MKMPNFLLQWLFSMCGLLGGLGAAAPGALAAAPSYRYSAPITVQNPAAFVQLPLPASTYAHSQQPGLADLRIVDAQGQRVPHALLPLRDEPVQREERLRPATLYALPPRASAGDALASPVDVLVQGDRITVRRKAGMATPTQSPGWLIDLGQRRTGEPAPDTLRLAWSGTAAFTAGLDIDVSDTLRTWRAGGSGQLLMLNAPQAPRGLNAPQTPLGSDAAQTPLVQRDIPLPANTPRFVRLVWRDAASAPRLTGAQAVTTRSSTRSSTQAQDLPSELRLPAQAVNGALLFDLAGALPIVALDLQLPPGTRVAPVQLQGRSRDTEAWQPLGSAVFYRIEREGTASRSPALPLHATVRYLRVQPDERAGALDPLQTQLVVHAALARIVFAAQGPAPYTLQVGSADAPPGALPITTLVPQLEAERPRLGRAELGAWTEVAAVAQAASAAARQAALRPWLLWAVLLAGVAGLGWMVWRLARG